VLPQEPGRAPRRTGQGKALRQAEAEAAAAATATSYAARRGWDSAGSTAGTRDTCPCPPVESEVEVEPLGGRARGPALFSHVLLARVPHLLGCYRTRTLPSVPCTTLMPGGPPPFNLLLCRVTHGAVGVEVSTCVSFILKSNLSLLGKLRLCSDEIRTGQGISVQAPTVREERGGGSDLLPDISRVFSSVNRSDPTPQARQRLSALPLPSRHHLLLPRSQFSFSLPLRRGRIFSICFPHFRRILFDFEVGFLLHREKGHVQPPRTAHVNCARRGALRHG
jgi:hypothetical protein